MKKFIYFFIIIVFLFSALGFSQEVDGVVVRPQENQTVEQINEDKAQCYNHADAQIEDKNHRTLKSTGIGVAIGAVVGKIIGKPGAGAAVGGAAGAAKGHRKSNKEEKAFNEIYASCLTEKGYSVEVKD